MTTWIWRALVLLSLTGSGVYVGSRVDHLAKRVDYQTAVLGNSNDSAPATYTQAQPSAAL